MPKPEIRKSYIFNKLVVIAPDRDKRPHAVEHKIPAQEVNCTFCSQEVLTRSRLGEVKVGDDAIFSVPNPFAVVSLDNKKAYGSQEVVIESTKHITNISDMGEKHILGILKLLAERTAELSKTKDIGYILCLKNHGIKAGASILHSHSQIMASKVIPPGISAEKKILDDYRQQKQSCYYCDLIKQEAKGPRIILSDKNVLAFTPYASEYYYEAWVFTKKHLDNITLLSQSELKSLAKVLKQILTKLKTLGLPFNLFFHQIVTDNDQHFYIKIQPRGSVWGGVELGSGMVINAISPEAAAKFYRK